MSASNTLFAPTSGSFRDVVARFVTQVRANRTLRAQRARVRLELDGYSDRDLADMGLSRGDIDDVVASVR